MIYDILQFKISRTKNENEESNYSIWEFIAHIVIDILYVLPITSIYDIENAKISTERDLPTIVYLLHNNVL